MKRNMVYQQDFEFDEFLEQDHRKELKRLNQGTLSKWEMDELFCDY